MYQKKVMVLLSVIIIFSFLLAACAPKTQLETKAPETQSVTQEPEKTTAPTPTQLPKGLITSLTELKKATIQIEAQGTFVDPEFGYIANAAGRGSGFIIDPSGIAVTNNHVVTGAALLKVWVGGDSTKVYNARILGVSECSDLAVIDIEGDGFPYLSWYEGPANVGLEVYAAGYPLGNPEFTMTKGIISKEKANGDTSWASVDSVIEHTSTINPGNSGGPLVDANARVVGVNYAGLSSANQYFAINRGTAQPVIERLKQEENVDSIGVNGQVVQSDDGSVMGVWVSSVESGSPADKTGLKPGDIIDSIENLYVGTDGTMNDYCDILRTHKPTDTLAIEINRWGTQEILQGQLNGRTLEFAYSYGGAQPTDTGAVSPTQETGANLPENCEASKTSGYITCWDNTNSVMLDVPDYWTDVNGGTWTYNGENIGYAISAAPSLDDFQNYFDAEGVFFGASSTFALIGGYVEFLDYYTSSYKSECTFVGRFDYNDGLYRGKYDQYSDCKGSGGYDAYVISAVDINNPTSKIILIEIQVTPGDELTPQQISATFYVGF